jgi:hypothetical protein
MSDQGNVHADNFDRVIGGLHGLPEHEFSRPSTVTSVLPMVGRSQTYVVQTCRMPGGGYVGFLQMVDAEGRARIAIPEKVMAALYRQREQLVKRARRETGKRVAAKTKLAAVSE